MVEIARIYEGAFVVKHKLMRLRKRSCRLTNSDPPYQSVAQSLPERSF